MLNNFLFDKENVEPFLRCMIYFLAIPAGLEFTQKRQ
jgi:hypothetical protein